MKRVATRD